jgi:4-hydroxy-4-methyl-2-oxoglutarate aldolase
MAHHDQAALDTAQRSRSHKRAIVPPTIVRGAPRPPTELVERLRRVYLPDVCDRVGPLYTMDSGIRPLYQPTRRILGVALTAKLPPADNLTVQLALALAQPGDVLVVDWRGYREACGTGAGSLTPSIRGGLAGVVIDGGWRDIAELQALDFPIFGRSISPISAPKARAGEVNVPVCCGGVIVNPGDIILGDLEGVVVVPRQHAQAVVDATDDYQRNATLQDWLDRRGDQRPADKHTVFEERFLADGGVYVDASEETNRRRSPRSAD